MEIGTRPEEPKPIKIMSKCKVRGKKQYRACYIHNEVHLCDWVNKELLDHYKQKQVKQNTKTGSFNGRHDRKRHY